MKITFHGAARSVTGSKHLLHINPDKNILLDCGLFQGMGKETIDLNSHWGFDPESISYVIISHAHVDHVGLLPKLVHDGYKGKIYCTPATLELAKLLIMDSAFIQESDITHVNKIRAKQGRPAEKPLYTVEDAEAVFPYLEPVPLNTDFVIDEQVTLHYTDAGHILGAAVVNLVIKENGKTSNLTFSGDIGRYRDLLLHSPDVFPQADFIVMESTYGNRLHDFISDTSEKLLQFILETCIAKKGKLIIPAFSVGRTQELLYLLNSLETKGKLPDLNYYVDSPLSIEATQIIKAHPECFNRRVQDLLKTDKDVFAFNGLRYLKTAQESIWLNDVKEPCVIISASGMAEAGRVKHHIALNIDNPANTILIVGYCEPHSLGGRLRNGANEVTIYGARHSVNARIGIVESLSAHADYDDLCQWLSCQDPKLVRKLFLVHGEFDAQQALKERLFHKGFNNIEIPELHQEVGLGS